MFAVFAASLGLRARARGDERFQAPARGDVLWAETSVDVRWTGRMDAPEQELILSLDGGLTFPIRVSPELSPRAGGYRWRVPDLPSASARLAVRTGSGEGSEEEEIRFVSEEFTILSSGLSDGAELLRGAREWWTRQALLSISAVDEMGQEVGSTVEASLPEDFLDLGDPDTVGPPGAARASGRLAVRRATLPAQTSFPALRAAVPLPLRL